jgi:hypothetical protein
MAKILVVMKEAVMTGLDIFVKTEENHDEHTRVHPKYSGLVPPSIQQSW